MLSLFNASMFFNNIILGNIPMWVPYWSRKAVFNIAVQFSEAIANSYVIDWVCTQLCSFFNQRCIFWQSYLGLHEINVLVIHIANNCFGIMWCCEIRLSEWHFGMMCFGEKNKFLLNALIQVERIFFNICMLIPLSEMQI